MIKITIGRKRFKGIYRWDEMSLRKFCELSTIPIPEGYEAYILADGKYDHTRQDSITEYVNIVSGLTDKQINEYFPAYYRNVVLCLSDVPERYLTDQLVTDLYEWHFLPFVASMIYNAPVVSIMGELHDYTPDTVKSFKIGSERFYLPESITLAGIDIPLAKEPIISYSEASDLFKELRMTKEASKLARFMAIYCRKKGELYSDDIVLSRQELFMDAPMSIVWNVFFCIARQLPGYMRAILLSASIPQRVEDRRRQARTYRSMAITDSYMK